MWFWLQKFWILIGTWENWDYLEKMFKLWSCDSVDLKTCWRSMTFSTVVWWASLIAWTRPIGHSDPQRISASNSDASSFDNRDVFLDIVLMVRSRKHQRQFLMGEDKTNQLSWFGYNATLALEPGGKKSQMPPNETDTIRIIVWTAPAGVDCPI